MGSFRPCVAVQTEAQRGKGLRGYLVRGWRPLPLPWGLPRLSPAEAGVEEGVLRCPGLSQGRGLDEKGEGISKIKKKNPS